MQARETPGYEQIEVNFSLSTRPEEFDFRVSPSKSFEPRYYKAEDEIMLGPGTWGRIITISLTVSSDVPRETCLGSIHTFPPNPTRPPSSKQKTIIF